MIHVYTYNTFNTFTGACDVQYVNRSHDVATCIYVIVFIGTHDVCDGR